MIGAVGDDDLSPSEALAGLHAAGVELELERAGTTGIALILVDRRGEPDRGRARRERPLETAEVNGRGAVLCQLEVPDEVVLAAAEKASFFALNAAPARPIDLEPDLLIVNRLEHEVVSAASSSPSPTEPRGPCLYENGEQVARARTEEIVAVDGSGAGDAFTACLVVRLLEGRPYEEALRLACAAGASAAATLGAQSSLPATKPARAILGGMTPTPIILDCDPGHDDAIALLLALASPELELVGVTTVSGNQTLDKTTANALRVLEFVGPRRHPGRRRRRRAARPRVHDVAAHVHGETGLDGPDLPPQPRRPGRAARRRLHRRADPGPRRQSRSSRPAR